MSRELGLKAGGATYESLRRHIRRLQLDGSHLSLVGDPRAPVPRRSWTDDDLREVARHSRGVSDVLRQLGYAPSGGMHRFIRAKMAALDIDTGHFTGQSWSRGSTKPRRVRVLQLEQILVAGSTYPSSRLRVRLVAAGLKVARCEVCGLVEWLGAPVTLALDHINGDPTDNRLENLRILCPNCHAQTDTWCRRNEKRADPA